MKNSTLNLLINPFTKIAGWKAFVIGSLVLSTIVFVGYVNDICFPGTISIKYSSELTLTSATLQQMISLLPMILLVYLSGLLFSKNVRFQDALGTITLARFPYIFVALSGFFTGYISEDTLVKSILDKTFRIQDHFGLLIFSFICLIFSIWVVILSYNAFKVSTNIKGAKSIVIFIVIAVLSEAISNIILLSFF